MPAELVCARTLAAEAEKRRLIQEKKELTQLRELIQVLGTLRTKGVLCDVIVTVEGHKFKAHKAVLAAGCGYFRTLFSQKDHQPSEGCTTEVIIQSRDVNSDSFENMLDYVYTGKLRPLVWDTIFETLACACYLQIKNAIQVSWHFLLLSLKSKHKEIIFFTMYRENRPLDVLVKRMDKVDMKLNCEYQKQFTKAMSLDKTYFFL